MKKIYVLLIVASLCLFTACGKEKESPVTITPTDSQESSSDEVTNETETDTTTSIPDIVIGKSHDMFSSQATIEETVLVDQDGYKITANKLEYSDYQATLTVTIENNTTEDLSFYSSTLGYSMNSINGYRIEDGYLGSDVTAGMKAIEEIYFDADLLKLNGIYDIAEIGLSFYVENSDNDTILITDLIKIPTSIFNQYDFSKDTIKEALNSNSWISDLSLDVPYCNTDFSVSQDGLNISAVAIARKESGDTQIILELENTTDNRVVYSSSDITINGITVSSGRWDSYCIPASTRALVNFNLDSLIDEEYRSLLSQDSIGCLSFKLSELDFDSYNELNSSDVSIMFDEKLANTEIPGSAIYDSNGIKVYQLPITEDDYGSYYYLPILIENHSGKKLSVDCERDSLSMNGIMLDYISFSTRINDNGISAISIQVRKENAEKIDISDMNGFNTGNIKLEIKDYDSYDTIDTPSIDLMYE